PRTRRGSLGSSRSTAIRPRSRCSGTPRLPLGGSLGHCSRMWRAKFPRDLAELRIVPATFGAGGGPAGCPRSPGARAGRGGGEGGGGGRGGGGGGGGGGGRDAPDQRTLRPRNPAETRKAGSFKAGKRGQRAARQGECPDNQGVRRRSGPDRGGGGREGGIHRP